MHARGVRSQENSVKNSFQAAKNFYLSSTARHGRNQIVLLGVFLASLASLRLNCRSAFTAKTQRTLRNPPSRNSFQEGKNFLVCSSHGIDAQLSFTRGRLARILRS